MGLIIRFHSFSRQLWWCESTNEFGFSPATKHMQEIWSSSLGIRHMLVLLRRLTPFKPYARYIGMMSFWHKLCNLNSVLLWPLIQYQISLYFSPPSKSGTGSLVYTTYWYLIAQFRTIFGFCRYYNKGRKIQPFGWLPQIS